MHFRSIVLITLLVAATSQGVCREFVFRPPGHATTVTLTGNAFGWKPDAIVMEKREDGSYAVDFPLPSRRFVYKFVVDGEHWFADPGNPSREPDRFGGFNSVIGDEQTTVPRKLDPVKFQVENVPPGFSRSWLPVRFQDGKLHFDDAKTSGGRLLLSAETISPDTTSPTLVSRQLFVWLPSGYDRSDTRYPVVYLHDGQNVWDDKTCCFGNGGWMLNSLVDSSTTIPKAILVGVPNSPARMEEYGLGDDVLAVRETPYLRYLRTVVKPLIDKEFRTLPDARNTTIMGSSMGGLISIFAGYRSPDIYGNVVAMSTAFMICDEKEKSLIDLLEAKGPGAFRLYLDSGTAGKSEDGAPLTRKFAALAASKGWDANRSLLHHEEPGADHNEAAWRARAWRGLSFALK